MILPLVQDMLTMSAQCLWTRLPQKFQAIKVVAKEKWPHIQIEEKEFKQNVKAQRQIVGGSSLYWLIIVNSKLEENEKRIALIHEVLHCFIDEIHMLKNKQEVERLVSTTEKSINGNN